MKQFQHATSYINLLVCVCVGGVINENLNSIQTSVHHISPAHSGLDEKVSAMLSFWIRDCKIFMFQVHKVSLLCLIDNVLKSS